MILAKDLEPPKPQPPPSSIRDTLGASVAQRHAHRIGTASDVLDTLIARAHNPRDGDEVTAIDALDTLALDTATPAYSVGNFCDDCFCAVAIRNLRIDNDVAEREWKSLSEERQQVMAEFSKRSSVKPPAMPEPHPNLAADRKRLAELDRDIARLDALHDARRTKFRELAGRSEGVFRALTDANIDMRPL